MSSESRTALNGVNVYDNEENRDDFSGGIAKRRGHCRNVVVAPRPKCHSQRQIYWGRVSGPETVPQQPPIIIRAP